MLGWIHTDETVEPVPNYLQLNDIQTDFLSSVPWTDDGRFFCPNLHWVRTGFARCPYCSQRVHYNFRFAHAYLEYPEAIPNTLWWAGYQLRVHDAASLPAPYKRDQYVKARQSRQETSSADVMKLVNAHHKHERKWCDESNGAASRANCGAAGQTFASSVPGNVPAWTPTSAAAQPPARHGPYFLS